EGLRAELIGRAEEWAKLQQALAEALQGRGQMVSLIGEPGVGKSRLVAELRDEEAQPLTSSPTPRCLWLEGRCSELGRTVAYGPFLDLLRECVAVQPEDDASLRAHRILSCLQELTAEGTLPDARIEAMATPLGHLLSARFEDSRDEWPHRTSPEQILHGT